MKNIQLKLKELKTSGCILKMYLHESTGTKFRITKKLTDKSSYGLEDKKYVYSLDIFSKGTRGYFVLSSHDSIEKALNRLDFEMSK